MAETPNPGSDEALDQGCLCAVIDNHHGRSAPWPPDGWWITEGCPVHAPKAAPEPASPLAAEPVPPIPGQTRPWPYDGPEGRARLTGNTG